MAASFFSGVIYVLIHDNDMPVTYGLEILSQRSATCV